MTDEEIYTPTADEQAWADRQFDQMTRDNDPVHSETSWYFYDETWTSRFGPFESETTARRGLKLYIEQVLG